MNMDIILNNVKMDVTLEDETNVSHVLEKMNHYLNDNKHILVTATVDGSSIDLYNDKKDIILTKDIALVRKISFNSLPFMEYAINVLKEIDEYLIIIQDQIKTLENHNENNRMDKITEDFAYIGKALHSIFPLFSVKCQEIVIEDRTMDSVLDEIDSILKNENIEQKNSVVKLQNMVDQFISLKNQLNEKVQIHINNKNKLIDQILKKLVESMDTIDDFCQLMSEIPVKLQVGDDAKAMHEIQNISDFLLEIIKQFKLLKIESHFDLGKLKTKGNEENPDDFFNGLNQLLTEIMEAFKVKDIIMLGDLIEYELTDKLNIIKNYISQICELFKIPVIRA